MPDDPGVFDAEVCTVPHPAGLIPIRLTDAVADAIAERTTPADPGAGSVMPRLRRVGAEFDVLWPDGRPDQPHRLRRDADGRVLLPTHMPLWHWQLNHKPATNTDRETR